MEAVGVVLGSTVSVIQAVDLWPSSSDRIRPMVKKGAWMVRSRPSAASSIADSS